MTPFRRPVTPALPNIFVPDRLPARTPGEDPITRLTEERDGVSVSLDEMTKERDELLDETKLLAAERDDLSARSLPCYGTATTWPPTKDPVHSRLFDEVAIELEFMPGQRTDGDELAQQDEVEA